MNILGCYLCQQTFCNSPDAVKHLKIMHFVKENVNKIFCIVRTEEDRCPKMFQTFRGMTTHAKKCLKTNIFKTKVECVETPVIEVNMFSQLFSISLFTKNSISIFRPPLLTIFANISTSHHNVVISTSISIN